MRPQLFSGARGKITFTDSNGVATILALVTDLSISENAGLKPTFVVGAENAVAIDPLSMDVTASIGRVIPISGGTDGKPLAAYTAIDLGFEEVLNTVLAKESVEIQVEDKHPSDPTKTAIVAVVKYARFAGRSTSVGAGDTASERYQFVGILDAGYNALGNSADEINYGLE